MEIYLMKRESDRKCVNRAPAQSFDRCVARTSQLRSHTYLFCVLPHGFSRKRERARSIKFNLTSFVSIWEQCRVLDIGAARVQGIIVQR